MSDQEVSVLLGAVRSLEGTVRSLEGTVTELNKTVQDHGRQLAAIEERKLVEREEEDRKQHSQLLVATIGSGLFCGLGVFILDHLHLFK